MSKKSEVSHNNHGAEPDRDGNLAPAREGNRGGPNILQRGNLGKKGGGNRGGHGLQLHFAVSCAFRLKTEEEITRLDGRRQQRRTREAKRCKAPDKPLTEKTPGAIKQMKRAANYQKVQKRISHGTNLKENGRKRQGPSALKKKRRVERKTSTLHPQLNGTDLRASKKVAPERKRSLGTYLNKNWGCPAG